MAKKKPSEESTPSSGELEPTESATVAESIAGNDPKPADASDGIGDDGPLIEGGESDPERAKLQREAEELRKEVETLKLKLSKVDELDMAIIDAGIEVDELEAAIRALDKDRKALKDDLKSAVATLRACVIRRKSGQKELFTEAQKGGAPIGETPVLRDLGAEASITVLLAKEMKKIVGKEEFQAAKDRGEPIGMTEKQIEILEGLGWSTIGKMEKGITDNEWWHRDIKGFGPDKIDRLTITLAAFRRKHPIPTADNAVEPNEPIPAMDTAADTDPQVASEAAETLATDGADAEPHQKAIAKLGSLIEQATALTNDGPDESYVFAESVRDQATDMRKWIADNSHVTPEQETAIANWEEGIAKWQPRA